MQDSTITYRVTVDGIEQAEAKFNALGATIKNVTVNQNGSVTASGQLTEEQARLAAATAKATTATNAASRSQSNYFAHIAKTTVQSALVNKAFLGLVESAGDAVKQVDLFSNFPAAMGALGLSTRDASASLLKLRDYSAQAGISLTQATQSVARFSEITRDVKAATAEFIGVNNALIAGGAGAEVQKNALEQLIQAYSRGKPQLIEWRSLMVAMPAQLNQVAKAMNQPNAQALGEQLTAGKISMQDFLTELTKMSTGTGPIAQQALARMQGIQFAANVMKNALTNGLAAIYQAVGKQNIISFFTFLTQVIVVLTGWVVTLINYLLTLFNILSRVFGGPQIAHFNADAQGAADAIGSGAGSADDMADGLGDAADNAKKISKSLAAFDKMNVLQEKESTDTGAGTGGLSAADASALNGIFDDLATQIPKISDAAKIFAGILASLVGLRFAKGILDQFNDVVKSVKTTKDNIDNLKKTLFGGTDETGKKIDGIAQNMAKVGDAAKSSGGKITTFLTGAISGVTGALAASLAGGLSVIGVFAAESVGIVVAAGSAAAIAVGAAVILLVIAIVAAIVGIIWLIWKNWDTIWGLMKNVVADAQGFIVAQWQSLYDVFAAPVKFLLQFLEATFILIVAIVATALELIFKLWVGTILLIYDILAAIAGWINTNVIQPVLNLFVFMWQGIVDAAVADWQFIYTNVLAPIASWINVNVVQPIINFFRSMWSTISGFASGFVFGIQIFLSPLVNWIRINVTDRIAGLFSGLWAGATTGLSSMIRIIENVMGSLGGIIKNPINLVIDSYNKIVGSLNRIKIPGTNVAPNFPSIPRLAKGGVIDQPTLSILGESGKEAVVPLENNTEWIDTLASKINDKNNGQPIQLVVQIGEDKVASKIIELINEKTSMSGRNAILV